MHTLHERPLLRRHWHEIHMEKGRYVSCLRPNTCTFLNPENEHDQVQAKPFRTHSSLQRFSNTTTGVIQYDMRNTGIMEKLSLLLKKAQKLCYL